MKAFQYYNLYPNSYSHTTYTINYLFVKTADASVLFWIQYIKSVLLAVIIHNGLFCHANIWILRNHLLTSLKYFCLDIRWKFHIQLSHGTNFGECISAHWYSFRIYQKYDETGLFHQQHACLHPTPDISMDYFQWLHSSHTHHPYS